MTAVERLTALLEPVITGLGYELVGLEYRPSPRAGLLRIYVDRPDGITVDDCALVSHQVSGVLDVEDPLPGRYTLEVSSPGLNRPIFKVSDYQRFVGERVRLRTYGLLDGRRKFHGVLLGLRGDYVVIDENGIEVSVPLVQVEKANLQSA